MFLDEEVTGEWMNDRGFIFRLTLQINGV